MKRLWTINWSRATAIEGRRDIKKIDAYGSCACICTEFEDALKALTKCKDNFLADINKEDVQDLTITGSEKEECFEIDFIAKDDSQVQIFIILNETDLFESGEEIL